MSAPAVSSAVRFPPALPHVRLGSRLAILAALVLAFATIRIDRFMGIAVETGWCSEPDRCLRLPFWLLITTVIVGLLVSLGVFAALELARMYFDRTSIIYKRRKASIPDWPADWPDRTTSRFADTIKPWTATLLRALAWTVVVLGLLVALARVLVATSIWTPAVLTLLAIVQVVPVAVSLVVLARVVAARGRKDADWSTFLTTLRRQRPTIVVAVLFAFFVLFAPIAADQVADALRALRVDSLTGGANVLFFLAAAALLSAAILEIWRGTDRAQTRLAKRKRQRHLRAWLWMIVGAALAATGGLLWWGGITGGGVVVFGALLFLVGFTDLPNLRVAFRRFMASRQKGRLPSQSAAAPPVDEIPPTPVEPVAPESFTPTPPPTVPATAQPSVAIGGRYVAAVPLVALAMATMGALTEALIAEPPQAPQIIAMGIVALAFGVLAIRMTRTLELSEVERGKRKFSKKTQTRIDRVSAGLNILVVLVLIIFGSQPALVIVAAAAAAATVVLHLWIVTWRESDPRVRYTSLKQPWKWFADCGWTVVFAVGTAVLTAVAVHLSPIDVARSVGTVGLLIVFVAGVLGVIHLLSLLSIAAPAPMLFAWFGMTRLPVFSGILIWWVLAGLIGVAPNLHDARIVDRAPAAEERHLPAPSLETAFDTWRAAQPEFMPGFEGPADSPVPLVLIASHGGGIRAAYWTGVVLDCIVGADASATTGSATATQAEVCEKEQRSPGQSLESARRVFLASGVSGGAVGLAAYSQQLLADDGLVQGASSDETDWVDTRLDGDLLAPVIGWTLFHDLPNHLVGVDQGENGECRLPVFGRCMTQDRAAVLEDALDRTLVDEGAEIPLLRGTWDARTDAGQDAGSAAASVPLLLFNSATLSDPHRAVTSAANLADWPRGFGDVADPPLPARYPLSDAAEVSDVLCPDQDLRLSTAAGLAARFPYISPSGVFHGDCAHEAGDVDPDSASRCQTSDTCGLQLSDGGDLENSGLLTLAQLLPSLRALVEDHNANSSHPIAIVVLDIDNDYRDLSAEPETTKFAGETLFPAQILVSGNAAMESAAYGLVHTQVDSDCFFTLAPASRPGIQAPLGWALSESSRQSLRTSIVASSDQVDDVRLLQHWLHAGSVEEPGALEDCNPSVVDE